MPCRFCTKLLSVRYDFCNFVFIWHVFDIHFCASAAPLLKSAVAVQTYYLNIIVQVAEKNLENNVNGTTEPEPVAVEEDNKLKIVIELARKYDYKHGNYSFAHTK